MWQEHTTLATALSRLETRGDEIKAQLALLADLPARVERIEATVARLDAVLRVVADAERDNRAQLWALREQPGYAAAWDEEEPLVTISIATHDRAALLSERSLPSVLAQSYERLEVLVIGDGASAEVEAVMRDVRDPRVTFVNVGTRFAQASEQARWLTGATMPRNEAYRRASGRWLLDFDDDDALRPDAVERLLALARSSRAEVAYGGMTRHAPDGESYLGAFPPQLYEFSFAAALTHAGLRFIRREHVAAQYGLPGDWYRAERMLRIGVRFVYLEAPLVDYYPSLLW